MVAANQIPKVMDLLSAERPEDQSSSEQTVLTEAERQDLLLEKIDLSGLDKWPREQAEKARSLLREYHDIFALEKRDKGCTSAVEHKIVLKDPHSPFQGEISSDSASTSGISAISLEAYVRCRSG